MIKIQFKDGSTQIINENVSFYSPLSTEVNGHIRTVTAEDKAAAIAKDIGGDIYMISIYNGTKLLGFKRFSRNAPDNDFLPIRTKEEKRAEREIIKQYKKHHK